MKALIGGLAVLFMLCTAGSAQAAFGIESAGGAATNLDGARATQAGSHPDLTTEIKFTTVARDGGPVPDGNVKDVSVELPPGVVGRLAGIARCTTVELSGGDGARDPVNVSPVCPAESQVGTVDLDFVLRIFGMNFPLPAAGSALYNMVPPRGVAARLAFSAGGTRIYIDASVRSAGDYNVVAVSRNSSQGLAITRVKVTVWGVPADPAHDALRFVPGSLNEFGRSSVAPRTPLVALPTSCSTAPLPTTVSARSWQEQDRWKSVSFDHDFSGDPMVTEGCGDLPFQPSVAIKPTSSVPGAPTGLNVDVALPQTFDNPDGFATAHLRDVKVTLPEGMSVSPSAAGGLVACSDEQAALDSDSAASCPDASKIGSVTATSPLLEETLTGAVYVGTQRSDDPASGEMFRLIMVVGNRERGIEVKLEGQVRLDPRTGRIETVFADNPQLPVESISLRLKSGPRAPLANPTDCGSKTIDTEMTSWAGHEVALSSGFAIDCPAPTSFAPAFDAGSVRSTGGAFSPLVVAIDRQDSDRFLSGVEVGLPKGSIAKLRGVDLCNGFQADNGGCPHGSRIGTATVAAGPGSSPFYVQGDVFLTEGYRGGPYGLAVHVHAKAGPFDLGWVRVRQALYVNPETAEISVVSDPLPQIVKGVPVRLKSVTVEVDRPGFAINPTSCAVKQVEATLTSVDGQVQVPSRRFQASDCRALDFTPRMAMRVTGRGQTRTGGHPVFTTVLSQKERQAGIARAKVTLPPSLVLDPLNTVDPKMLCGYDESLKADCPATSVIGKASAVTPVLDRPLAGSVYLVQGIKFGPEGNRIRTTPSLLVKLRGEVAINLRGRTTTERGTNRLVTTFGSVPDAPVSKFTLKINGGSEGILVVTRTRRGKINLCNSSQLADVETDGHNGKRADYRTALRTPCGKRSKKFKRATR